MVTSLNIGKIFGIRLRIHITFFLLLLLVFFTGLQENGIKTAFIATGFICSIFACVVIHEVGHSLIARRFGKETKSITLLPIGGVAALEEVPEKPLQEIAMAIIGPMINLVIAGLLYSAFGWWSGAGVPELYPNSAGSFVAGLIAVNIILAIFNLTPAFPMDGGRVFRGILALKMDFIKATRIAVLVGQIFAVIFIVLGFYFQLWIIMIIGIFLFLGAGAEKKQVIIKSILHKVTAGEAMNTQMQAVNAADSVSTAMQHFRNGYRLDFPVLDGAKVVGILRLDSVLSIIRYKKPIVIAGELIDKDFPTVTSSTPLDVVYKQLVFRKQRSVAVIDGGVLRGFVSLEGINRYFSK